MNLDDYLSGLRSCSNDGKLISEFGISIAWPVYLFGDFSEVIKELGSSGNFRCVQESEDECFFDYAPGLVELKLVPTLSSYGFLKLNSKLGMEHHRRQVENYNMSIILNPFQNRSLDGVSRVCAIKIVAEEICSFMRDNHSICLPRSVGLNYMKPEVDWERIVYSDRFH